MKKKLLIIFIIMIIMCTAGIGTVRLYEALTGKDGSGISGSNRTNNTSYGSSASVSSTTVSGDASFTVVSSFYPIYVILENIADGAEGVEVHNLTENATGCLHDYTLSTKDMKRLAQADLFIINGIDTEPFLDDIAGVYPQLPTFSCTDGIALICGEGHVHEAADSHDEDARHDHEDAVDHDEDADYDHEDASDHDEDANHDHNDAVDHDEDADHNHNDASDHGESADHDHEDANHEEDADHNYDDADAHDDEHAHNHVHEGEYNGHVWTDMNRYLIQIENVCELMCSADPEHASIYRKNAEKYSLSVKTLRDRAETALAGLRGERVIIFHDSFAYFADEFGLEVAYTLELEDDEALSGGEIAKIIEIVREENVRFMFVEKQYSDALARGISQETDAEIICLDSMVTGDGAADSYLKSMEENIKVLEQIENNR